VFPQGVLTFVPVLVKIDPRNVTVRVLADRQTDTQTARRKRIICPMLYAIAMGQINTHS